MKRITILFGLLFSVGTVLSALADSAEDTMVPMEHHDRMAKEKDGRIPLGIPEPMKQHQLANMRSHLEAIQSIIGLIGEGKFDAAAEIAHARLGLTEEMKKMCSMFDNRDFRRLGLAFHESADALAEALKTKDVDKSLGALHETMGYCVRCHATYRQ
ncbi:MAG TPA: cytochrome C [Gammaproteobacteria bacterium]|nr:cytochrome C [Gammaproteobacteria bacterium]